MLINGCWMSESACIVCWELPCSGKESRETQEGQASVGDPRASIFQVDTTQTRVQARSSCLANFLIGFESYLPLKRALLLRSALDNGARVSDC